MKNFMRFVFRCFLRTMKIRVAFQMNEADYPAKSIYVSNHVSWLDPLIMFAFLPNDPVFFLHPRLYRNKWLRMALHYATVIEYNYMDAADAKKAIELINQNRSCVMFPEGCMTNTGEIMKVYEAPAVIADRTGAVLVPIWISGAEYSPFSETKFYQPHRLFPKIKVKVGTPHDVQMDEKLKKNRDYLRDLTYHLLNNMRFEVNYKTNLTIFHQLLRVSRIYGKTGLFTRRKIVEDINRQPQSYMDILVKSYILGKKFTEFSKKSERVGLMLPNTVATVVSFFGLSAYARVPVMLNFSQGSSVVTSMCRTAEVKHVITSKAFILKAKMEETIKALEVAGIKIVYLENVAKKISLKEKLAGLFAYKIKKIPVRQETSDEAVILFTSGSEGFPKAVVLSHANIVSNVQQTVCMLKLSTQDLMFDSLPMFHSFGLTVGMIFPLFSGARVFLFPSPLLYRTITELLYELKATIMVATDTFYRMYAKISHPYDFKSLRACYAGAEAVKEDTRRQIAERLGCQLMEGYGTTECSPILCVNTLLFNKFGTLGRLAPGIEYKLEEVPGITVGKEFLVRGPNVMKGYMFADNPGVLVPNKDGWYHTGDVVVIDDLGFVKIVDRVKRFAKIAGEMISLTAVENIAHEIWKTEDFHCGIVAIPHPKKGEQIVMVSNEKDLDKDKFSQKVQRKGMSELYVPSLFMYKEEIPIFATGKADNVTLKKWVLKELEEK